MAGLCAGSYAEISQRHQNARQCTAQLQQPYHSRSVLQFFGGASPFGGGGAEDIFSSFLGGEAAAQHPWLKISCVTVCDDTEGASFACALMTHPRACRW